MKIDPCLVQPLIGRSPAVPDEYEGDCGEDAHGKELSEIDGTVAPDSWNPAFEGEYVCQCLSDHAVDGDSVLDADDQKENPESAECS